MGERDKERKGKTTRVFYFFKPDDQGAATEASAAEGCIDER